MLYHTIPPIFNDNSRVLILGSFPSVLSRESGFYYGHPRNRFWRVIATVFNEVTPREKDEKVSLLLNHRLALWDVVSSCNVVGSSDSSITDVIPNDLSLITGICSIERIILNGKTAERYFNRCNNAKSLPSAVCLPSTSPANAAYSLQDLIEKWQIIRN